MAEVMAREIAEKEVNKWLEHKRVKDSVRENQKAQIGVLVDAMQYGDISLNEDTFAITQKLVYPDEVKSLFTELTFKPRMSIGDLQRATSQVKMGDFNGTLVGYVSALTDRGVSHILKMDSDDFKICQAIAVFFM